MSRLNEFQAQHVESTFAHVDKLLTAAEALTQPNSSPFTRERPDVTPQEARFLAGFGQQMRVRMLAALDRLGLPRPQSRISARHSADVTLRFAELALADLSPSNLRGYGEVDPDAAAEVAALATDLRGLIERGRALFGEQDTGGLATRMATLSGNFGEALRALEQFSAEHALADVRPLLAEAAERVAAETFDVGVFGRVSAGKSSLVNALIGTNVLPVGATPVTAVPLRLHYGELGAVVHFEDGASRNITAGEIVEYGTEERNPGNRAHVRAIEIGVPSVPPGLRFLDTPGIGSLSASAPAQAFAWLPRCDVGLVLIAAGTPVGTDDLALVSGFVNAGITCQVLLSKSDLLTKDEIAQGVAYVQRELATVLGGAHDITVRPVSTAPGARAQSSLADFRSAVLEPLAVSHARAVHDALRARLHRLVAMTRSALAESDTGDGDAARIGNVEPKDPAAAVATRRVQRQMQRDSAHSAIRQITDALAGSGARVIDAAASAVVATWGDRGEAAAAAAAARAAIIRETGIALDDVRRAVENAAENDETTAPASRPADRRLPPLFDADLLNNLPDLSPPRVLMGTRHNIAERRLAPLRTVLDIDLRRYAGRLYAWGEQALKESMDREPQALSLPQSNSTEGVDALDRINGLIDAAA